MEIKIVLDENAYIEEKAYATDAGYDIRTPKTVTVPAKGSAIIDSGVHALIPSGYVGMLKSKSGLNVKHGIVSEGVIDSGFLGSIVVKLYNNSDEDYEFAMGDKITQLVILPIAETKLTFVEKFENGTPRADRGFGSTGK